MHVVRAPKWVCPPNHPWYSPKWPHKGDHWPVRVKMTFLGHVGTLWKKCIFFKISKFQNYVWASPDHFYSSFFIQSCCKWSGQKIQNKAACNRPSQSKIRDASWFFLFFSSKFQNFKIHYLHVMATSSSTFFAQVIGNGLKISLKTKQPVIGPLSQKWEMHFEKMGFWWKCPKFESAINICHELLTPNFFCPTYWKWSELADQILVGAQRPIASKVRDSGGK